MPFEGSPEDKEILIAAKNILGRFMAQNELTDTEYAAQKGVEQRMKLRKISDGIIAQAAHHNLDGIVRLMDIVEDTE